MAVWIYRDANNDKSDGGLYLHVATCPRCNHGDGTKRKRTVPQLTATHYRGEPAAWVGPFDSEASADEYSAAEWSRKPKRHSACLRPSP